MERFIYSIDKDDLTVFIIFRRGVYEGEKYPMVMSMYITIVSRVLISSHTVFSQVLSRLAAVHNETEEIVMLKILRVWLAKMPNVSQMEQRKVMGKRPI